MNNKKYTVKKKQCEQYDLYFNQGMDGATIFLDSNATSGTISIVSSYGNYSYYFSSTGMNFKDFLSKLNFDYFMKKTYPKYMKFNFEDTINQYKATILEDRRNQDITKEEALEYWEDLNYIEDCGNDINYFFSELDGTSFGKNYLIDDYYDTVIKKPCVQAVGFWEEVWPKFMEILQKEKQE